jgi:hypothetical protein
LNSSQLIFQKLEAFTRKYYTNELLRGLLLFVGIGLLYFIATVSLEYFLWLKVQGRTLLFWVFVLVELGLFIRFILLPVFKLIKLQKGINYTQASVLIGKYFPEIDDKLLNFLQLIESKESQASTELLLASIDQKALKLQPIPFSNAIRFSTNKKYLPLALLPVLLCLFFYLSGEGNVLSDGLHRVVNYRQQFSPPAPFRFEVLNANLQTEQHQDFTLRLRTVGKVIPENVEVFLGNENYFMEQEAPGVFRYTFDKPTQNLRFYAEANSVYSPEMELQVVQVPAITNLEMQLHFPAYLGKKPEQIKGTGNGLFPEGTRITWLMQTQATTWIDWVSPTQQNRFTNQGSQFSLTKTLTQNTNYSISTSNAKIKHYETFQYQIGVIKDQFPSISVDQAPDSIKTDKPYLIGQVSDDYGLTKIQLAYYPKEQPQLVKYVLLPVHQNTIDRFVYAFPGNLPLLEGTTYDYYFEVFDNDAPHGFKSSKSSVFSSRLSTQSERENKLLQQQNSAISSMEKSLKNQDKQLDAIDKIQKAGKEKDKLEFKDQQKVNDFIQRQKQQDDVMKAFAEKMKENLDQFKSEKKDPEKEELEKRLQAAQKDLEKNQKLLDELKALNDKIKNEDLLEKLDQFKQKSKNQTKNLEQLVELTKKYYVEKKAEQLLDQLEKLAQKQDQLAENDKENSAEKQNQIQKEFDQFQKEMNELQKENKELKAPIDLPKDPEKEKSIEEDLQKAASDLQKNQKSQAKPSQKSASKKMKEMAQKLGQSMEGGEKEQLEEDVKMLRQILDNLLAFSFSQENLIMQFKGIQRGAPSFTKQLKTQQDLKLQFKHVDDSLFSLSLRNPKIAENITQEIGNVHYNLDKALDNLVEAQIPKGVSHQQYTIAAANKLADFLSETLNSMQMSLSGMGQGKPKPGKGQGQGMQLPDIIKKQDALGDKMQGGKKKGQKPGESQSPGQGQKPGEGKDGKSGKQGQSGSGPGSSGENGQEGEGDARSIMEIYKEQQQLREALQQELAKKGMGGSGQSAVDQMKQIERQLINKGFSNDLLQKALNLKYELLKLDKALQLQGEEQKRQAETNKSNFLNTAAPLPAALQQYIQSVEILNRQSLPLRPNFTQKVQEYFQTHD